MKRRILALLAISLLTLTAGSAAAYDYPFTIAHRGCWLSGDGQFTNAKTFAVTENSLEAVRMAAVYGYKAIELDPKMTSDGVIVVMHDKSINRTMVCADGSEIPQKVNVKDCSFSELRTKYRLRSTLAGNSVLIPTLRELIEECSRCGVMPLVHCKFFEAFACVKEIVGDDFIAFSSKLDVLKRVRKVSSCKILLDPGSELSHRKWDPTPQNVLTLLDEIGGDTGISSMKHEMCSAHMCEALRAAGHDVQSSIFASPAELTAVRNGVSILLSDFAWAPASGMRAQQTKTALVTRELHWQGKRFEYGAFTVELEGSGEWEVDICGERKYVIRREVPAKEIISLRYYDRRAEVHVKVLSGEGVKLSIRNYRFTPKGL